jgi:hypothetical protein
MEKIVIKSSQWEKERMLFQAISILFPECQIEILPDNPTADEDKILNISQTELKNF